MSRTYNDPEGQAEENTNINLIKCTISQEAKKPGELLTGVIGGKVNIGKELKNIKNGQKDIDYNTLEAETTIKKPDKLNHYRDSEPHSKESGSLAEGIQTHEENNQ